MDEPAYRDTENSPPRPDLFRRIWDQVQADDCIDLAAQISFYFILSLFPFFLVMATIVGWLPSTALWKSFATWMVTYLPIESRSFVFSIILNLSGGSKGILSVGLATTIWSASSGLVSLMESLSIAHGRRDSRSFWRKHAIAVCFTFLAALFALACFGLMTLGRWGSGIIPWLSNGWNLPGAFWEAGRWAATVVLMCVGVDLANYFLPDRRRSWHWITPGTAFAVLMLVIATVALNLYVLHFPSYPRIYGTLGGFIVLMLWIYIANFILLVGAEIDHQIEASAIVAVT
ncbi:MAG: YihY/virulence factor BrkB family protein [Candidatus Acidiferrales bacterium]